MSKQKLKMFIPVLCVSFVGLVTVVSIKHASTHYSESPNASNGVQLTQRSRGRNLSLRPGAFNMARRLGTRFLPENPQRSLIAGTIRTGSENRVFQMVREQTGDGEQVEIGLDQSAAVLRWDARDGATSFGSRASGRDRDLIEKLVFDSADYFVLAQLRGAAYSTVARNVLIERRENEFANLVCDIVRIDDPERDEFKRPESQWRLYYVNRATGLIDRIVYEVHGETIQADLTNWATNSGETFPARIVWSRDSETVMEIAVSALTRANVQ